MDTGRLLMQRWPQMIAQRMIHWVCVTLALTSVHVARAQQQAAPTPPSAATAATPQAAESTAPEGTTEESSSTAESATSPEQATVTPQAAADETSTSAEQSTEEPTVAPPVAITPPEQNAADKAPAATTHEPQKPASDEASAGGAAAATAAAEEAAAEANNPLSNLTSISFQDYKTLEISQDTEETQDQAVSNIFYLRFAKSLGKRLILRASLPLVSTYNEGKSGLGDMNVILPILLNGDKSPLKFGVGPLLNLPTNTDGLGADAWGVGLSATAFYMKSLLFQPGALVTWSYNLGADTPADEGNLITVQPFLFFQLGHGTYLRSSAVATLDIEHDGYNVPVGLGIGQVVKQGRTVFNLYAEGQQTIWSYGALLPTSQLFFGLNVQILPKK